MVDPKAWARVNCPEHGLQLLDYDGYSLQLERHNHPWHCPKCGKKSTFDDVYFETAHGQEGEA